MKDSRGKISEGFALALAIVCTVGGGILGLITEKGRMVSNIDGSGLTSSRYNISEIVNERKLRQSTDLKFFAWAICNEEIPYSKTEGFEQEALRILQTIENRAEHCDTTIADTITRQAQFSFLNSSKEDPRGPEIKFNKESMSKLVECENRAVEIMLGPREVWTANFYHATTIPLPKWAEKMIPVGKSGGHAWYRSGDRNYCEAEKDLPLIVPQGRKTETSYGFLVKRLQEVTGKSYH